MHRSARSGPQSISWIAWLLLVLILLGAFLIRWRLRECPLERDEGEYAYIGRLILEGAAPYGVAGNHKFPGAYLAYAAIMAMFGQTIAGIHLGMLAINLVNTGLVFALGRRLSGNVTGVAAAAAWVLMSVSPGVLGNAGHLTHFVVLAVLGGLLLLLHWAETGRTRWLIGAGVCLGISVVFRQTSLAFVGLGIVYVWLTANNARMKQAAMAAGAALLPLIVMVLWLCLAGVFPQFWRWTFAEAAAYGSQLSLAAGFQMFLRATPLAISWSWLIWAGAGMGLALALFKRTRAGWLMIGLLLVGMMAMAPGFYFREHYYVQVLPAIALLFGMAVEQGWKLPGVWRAVAVIGAVAALALPLVQQRTYYLLETNPTALSRYIYGGNPFPETLELARYVRENSEPGEPVAVLGSEPQIFFYAQRRSATSLIYTYPLMEQHRYAHGLQETMAREIEEKTPKFIVFLEVPTSWLTRPESDRFILDWADQFLARNYQLDGVVDILASGSQYIWGGEAAGYRVRSPYFIALYRRVGS